MRPITRNVLLGIGVVLVLLLALGALPGLLKSGDPYYVEAAPVEDTGSFDGTVNASDLAERRFSYTTEALANATDGPGYSKPYWKGPFGLKGAFTHSPFDELSSMGTQYPNASDGGTAVVSKNGSVYRVTVTQTRQPGA